MSALALLPPIPGERASLEARRDIALNARDLAMRHARMWAITMRCARSGTSYDRARRQAALCVRRARGSNRVAVTMLRALSA